MKWSTKSRWPWLAMEKSLGHLLPSVPSVLVWVWTDKGRMAFWRMIPPRGLWQHGAGSGWDLLCESPLELSLREQEKVVMLFRMIFWTSAVKEGYKICKEKRIRKHYEEIYAKKLGNLDKTNKLWAWHKVQKLTRKNKQSD